VLGDVPAQLRALVEAGLVQLPGIMVIGGVVIAVTALLPRWAGAISWTVVLVSILLGPLFGAATLQLPQWMQDLSPFSHIPKAPAADVTTVPVVSLLAISAVLAVAGVVALRRRNLALPV
jgi:ABC-2 type transport system permease protein